MRDFEPTISFDHEFKGMLMSSGENEVSYDNNAGSLKITGTENIVQIAPNARLDDTHIVVIGNRNRLFIEEGCILNKAFISFTRVDNSTIKIGKGTTAGSAFSIQIHEESDVIIGEDCMFSTGVFIVPTDMHPIFDLNTGERLNPSKSIDIGRHVWLGRNVTVNKGVTIGDGSIIGGGAIVTKSIPANCSAAGVPAKILREGVQWMRNFSDKPPARP